MPKRAFPLQYLISIAALFVASCGQPVPEASHPVMIAAPEPEVDAEEEPTESAFAEASAGSSSSRSSATTEKVSFELYMMSKCPFGTKVLQAIAPVLEELGKNLDLEVNYIGRDKDGELTSMHGEDEVRGDILHLCAAEIGGRDRWREFVVCLAEDWRMIPNDWLRCARDVGLDLERMESCYEGPKGRNLLRASFEKSMQRRATGSPTIFLADEPYRGGRSKVAMMRAICKAFEGPQPAPCERFPTPIDIPVTVISDERCAGRGSGCDVTRFVKFVQSTFEISDIRELDYSDPEAKRLYESSGERYLPIAIFGPEVEKHETGYDRLKRRLKKFPGTNDWVYSLGRDWDPTAEICDDGVDNTDNGKVDCQDATCVGKQICREEIPGKLQLFVMSRCPYCNKILVELPAVLKSFGRDRKRIEFSLEFIGTNDGGKLSSMRGQPELAEDMRMVCAQKYYPARYKFMEYVTCRAAAIQKAGNDEEWDAWKKCAKNGIKAAVIEKCADSREGKKLLEASFGRAADLDITASPTWLLNNKHDMQGRTADEIEESFCEKNPRTKGCK